MKKTYKILTALLVVLTIASAAFAQKVTIDMKFNVSAADAKTNYFNWTKDKMSVKDAFDAATGASKAGSTEGFNAVRYDNETNKKAAIPAGLRSLVLYPVSNDETRVADAFIATANGKQITVRFVHRGTAYLLETDKSGKLNVLTGFKIAPGLATQVAGKFTVKPEYSKTGAESTNMNDIDWSKVTYSDDKYSPEAAMHYEGTLTVSLSKNILSVKGTLNGK